MKRVLSVLLAVLLVLAMTACGTQNEDPQSGTNDDVQSTGDAQYTVGIIQLSEHSALDSAREGFIAALADNGLVDGENLEIDFQNAQNDQSNLGTIADRFVSKDVDLVLAIATPAAQTMAGKTTEIPIIATAVTDFAEARLVNDNDNPGTNVSGTSAITAEVSGDLSSSSSSSRPTARPWVCATTPARTIPFCRLNWPAPRSRPRA